MLSKRYANDRKAAVYLNDAQRDFKKSVEEKIDKGVYLFEKTPCCVCGGEDFEKLSEKDRHGLFCPVVICKGCGLIQQNPRLSQRSLADFYTSDYHDAHVGVRQSEHHYLAFQYKTGKEIHSFFKDNLGLGLFRLKIFEFGCAYGGILRYFKEKGNEVSGVDIVKDFVDFGNDHYGLGLINATLATADLPWVPDIAIFSRIIEHMRNPVEEMKRLRDKLGEKTFIYVQVPSMRAAEKYYGRDFLHIIDNKHTYYFTAGTLQNAMNKAGYRLVCCEEKKSIRAVFRPEAASTGEKASLCRNTYEDDLNFLKKMERRRFLPSLYKTLCGCQIVLIDICKALGLYEIARKMYYRSKKTL